MVINLQEMTEDEVKRLSYPETTFLVSELEKIGVAQAIKLMGALGVETNEDYRSFPIIITNRIISGEFDTCWQNAETKEKEKSALLARTTSLISHFDFAFNIAKLQTRLSEVVEDYNSKKQELETEVKKLERDIETEKGEAQKAKDALDGKMFSLLTNTVAILGIFVAIAFTGLGAMSIFSNIDFETAMKNTATFVQSVFFILLVATLVYNLLIVLVYFIYKLSRPMSNSTDTGEKQTAFSKSLPLKPFLWVDGGLALLTAGAFIASLFVQ